MDGREVVIQYVPNKGNVRRPKVHDYLLVPVGYPVHAMRRRSRRFKQYWSKFGWEDYGTSHITVQAASDEVHTPLCRVGV